MENSAINDNTKLLSLERARELIDDQSISDEELKNVILSIKELCSIVCRSHIDQASENRSKIIELSPPNQDSYSEAA